MLDGDVSTEHFMFRVRKHRGMGFGLKIDEEGGRMMVEGGSR